MNIQIELSLYPLRTRNLSDPIKQFCESLKKNGLDVRIGPMTTSLSGEVSQVFDAVRRAFCEVGENRELVLLLKASNACPSDTGPGEKILPLF